ncbi:hypothetical protein BH11PSE11_BH11PSE11_24280 [soil metagenome]
MDPDIWIVRDGDVYRLLHGHLHLASRLSMQAEVMVNIPHEGSVRIIKSASGLVVEQDQRRSLLKA